MCVLQAREIAANAAKQTLFSKLPDADIVPLSDDARPPKLTLHRNVRGLMESLSRDAHLLLVRGLRRPVVAYIQAPIRL